MGDNLEGTNDERELKSRHCHGPTFDRDEEGEPPDPRKIAP